MFGFGTSTVVRGDFIFLAIISTDTPFYVVHQGVVYGRLSVQDFLGLKIYFYSGIQTNSYLASKLGVFVYQILMVQDNHPFCMMITFLYIVTSQVVFLY